MKQVMISTVRDSVLVAGLMLAMLVANAQDIHFSQFMQAPLLLNPALAGDYHGNVRLSTNYKNQWLGALNAYQTYVLTGDMSFYEDKSTGYTGVGMNIFRDVAGDVQLAHTQFSGVVAHHVAVNDHQYLGGGITIGYASKSINPAEMEWQNQYDGSGFNSGLPSGETMGFQKVRYADLGAGISWNYTDPVRKLEYRAGVSLLHLNRPKQTAFNEVDRMSAKIGVHYDMYIPAGENWDRAYLPSFAFFSQGTSKELIVGCQYLYMHGMNSKYTGELSSSAFVFGLYYRAADAIIPMFGYHHQESVKALISYDFNVSRLTPVTNARGGFEVSLVFTGFTKGKASIKVVKDVDEE